MLTTPLVLRRYGKDVADAIDWNGPRLICIAADFTKNAMDTPCSK